MSNTIGKNYKLTVFGESHGKSIGVIIEGVKPGISIDFEKVKKEMDRRKPGKYKISTSRKEGDIVDIQSGIFEDKTTGAAICGIIQNKNTRSKDYSLLKRKMRPGHSDLSANKKYKGFNDHRGGGQFSGRLTAPLVFAGAIAKQILKDKNIIIGSHIKSIKDIKDRSFEKKDLTKETLDRLKNKKIPTLNIEKSDIMEKEILKYKEQKNSVGGVVEGVILNMPPGLGQPLFDSVESKLSKLIFSIPGVKGVEFGSGFKITQMTGKEANDEYFYDEDKNIKAYSNNNGGIVGGISNGVPINLKVAFKPTPSIGLKQRTIDIEKQENTELKIEGRHDPCIVPRALVVVEACMAIVTLDLLLEGKIWQN